MTSSERRKILAAALRRDAALQEEGKVEALGAEFDALDQTVEDDETEKGAPRVVHRIAWSFYDAWLDERNHGFPGHRSGIARADWPALARALADDLEVPRVPKDGRLIRAFG